METVPKTVELDVGLCLEDFANGDRIYQILTNGPRFGMVWSVSDTELLILWDGNSQLYQNISHPTRERLGNFGKPLDLKRVTKGSVISYKFQGKGRFYAEVTEYIPGELLSYRYLKNSSGIITVSGDNEAYMERRMMRWELED